MGKFREKRLADSNSDTVEATLRLCIILKRPSLFFKFFKNYPHSSFPLSHTKESITNSSIGKGITCKLVGCQFRALG